MRRRFRWHSTQSISVSACTEIKWGVTRWPWISDQAPSSPSPTSRITTDPDRESIKNLLGIRIIIAFAVAFPPLHFPFLVGALGHVEDRQLRPLLLRLGFLYQRGPAALRASGCRSAPRRRSRGALPGSSSCGSRHRRRALPPCGTLPPGSAGAWARSPRAAGRPAPRIDAAAGPPDYPIARGWN